MKQQVKDPEVGKNLSQSKKSKMAKNEMSKGEIDGKMKWSR